MSLISRMRRQRAVYWAPSGADESGQPLYEEPIEIACRWQDEIVEFIDYKGRKTISQSRVFPDRELEPGGMLWNGELSDLDSLAVPTDNTRASEILAVGIIPNLRNSENLYDVLL